MSGIDEFVWDTKYRQRRDGQVLDRSPDDSWRRVAGAIAAMEPAASAWEARFHEALASRRFLPGGRILAGAGTGRRVTLFNCFVSGTPEDNMDSILDSLKEAALTMQQGGGVGCDFSRLRPAGLAAVASGGVASGPVSFMRIWDAMCDTLLSTSARRGAMMATLRCDHPDIETFIHAKRNGDALHNFNLSVQVSDAFMQAVADDADWALRFPARGNGDVTRRLQARDLWAQIAAAATESAEPGLLFIDQVNRENNLAYRETISATNPCGEIPLPPYGACNLGSINLPVFIERPFTGRARMDEEGIRQTVGTAVRFLDDVIDASRFPLARQAGQAKGTRRIGLGVTGLADTFLMLGLHYDSDDARALAKRLLQLIRDAAYEASVRLASEKGSFPFLDRQRFLRAPFVRRLEPEQRQAIRRHGLRNSHLLSIAPAGSISLLAGNVSSGIEPVFAWQGTRRVRGHGGELHHLEVRDYAYARWLDAAGASSPLPDCFVTARELGAHAHLAMQAALQPLVDNAISKTVNLPGSATSEEVADLYAEAYRLGLKGCTVYREGSLRGQVLEAAGERHCCRID